MEPRSKIWRKLKKFQNQSRFNIRTFMDQFPELSSLQYIAVGVIIWLFLNTLIFCLVAIFKQDKPLPPSETPVSSTRKRRSITTQRSIERSQMMEVINDGTSCCLQPQRQPPQHPPEQESVRNMGILGTVLAISSGVFLGEILVSNQSLTKNLVIEKSLVIWKYGYFRFVELLVGPFTKWPNQIIQFPSKVIAVFWANGFSWWSRRSLRWLASPWK